MKAKKVAKQTKPRWHSYRYNLYSFLKRLFTLFFYLLQLAPFYMQMLKMKLLYN